MARKRITIGQFFDAMEANAIPKAQGDLVKRNAAGAIVQACAYGQAALHLGVIPQSLYDTLTAWAQHNGIKSVTDVVNTNDSTPSTVPAIARWYRSQTPAWVLNTGLDIEVANGHE